MTPVLSASLAQRPKQLLPNSTKLDQEEVKIIVLGKHLEKFFPKSS